MYEYLAEISRSRPKVTAGYIFFFGTDLLDSPDVGAEVWVEDAPHLSVEVDVRSSLVDG